MEEILQILEDYTPEQSAESIEAVEQFNPETHKVMSRVYRPNKTVYKPVLDISGEPMLDSDGNQITRAATIEVSRVPVSMQKTIVDLRKFFMNLRGSVLASDNDDSLLLTAVQNVRKKNKYAFKIEEIAERTMSELQSAEMWWINPNNEIKMRVLSPEKGDLLLPIFDDFGDMKYFLRTYTIGEDTFTDIFTDTENYTFDENGNLVQQWSNAWGKIPIIYYSQPLPEWHEVQDIIERYETILSNLADNNDYTGNPITVVKGQINGFAAKEESGKVLMLEPDADVNYLTHDNAPASVKLEIDELRRLMYSMSHTPDITIEALKNAGGSGTAFDRLFIDPQLAAEAKLTGVFGESMQRSVNLVSAMCRSIDSSLPNDFIEVETKAFRFDDIDDFVKNMVLLKGVLSNETITKLMAGKFGINEGEEWERVRTESGVASIEMLEE